jgi:type II secretory pathway component GspD/PulD (secretin)
MRVSQKLARLGGSAASGLLTLCLLDALCAQERIVIQQDGLVVQEGLMVDEIVVQKAVPEPPAEPTEQPPKQPQKPGEQAKPGETPGKAEGKPGQKPPEKPAETARPRRKPTKPADPAELKVRPDDDRKIAFSFKNQDWEDVLEWLADISDMSLQMEEVPPGFLSLTSRGRYLPEQVQDLVNSALINKGYTLLRNDEVLLVSKLDKLDKSLVPRVDPKQLEQRGTYEFVKCFFDLDSLVADAAATEIQPMLSTHGKVTALKTTNRLDVLDTAGNMRRIRDLLDEEQSDRGKENVLREFKLLHVRATDVHETLHTILGLKKPGPTVALTPDQIGQMQQQFMQAAQMAAQQAGKGGAGGGRTNTEVFLAVNNAENSILANAPPDKMTIIEQAVKAMDIQRNRSESLLSNLPRLRSYKLSAVDPSSLVKVLQDLGNLDPHTRLEVDARSRSIIAFATPIDHVTIQAMVDKIDGTGRHFEVVQLYVLDAEMVAGSIEFLMRGPDERRNSRPYWWDWEYGGSRSRQDRDPADQLQVEADTERNRLLLRATDAEMKEIHELLAKLGEVPERDRSDQTMRVVPMSPGDAQQLIERLQNAWPSVRPNPLRVTPPETPTGEGEQPRSDPTARPEPVKAKDAARAPREPTLVDWADLLDSTRPQAGRLVRDDFARSPAMAVAQTASVGPRQPRDDRQRPDAPPVAITVGPHGLVVSSEDTEALDQLERMIGELAPPQRVSQKLFYLKNSFCKDVADVLKDIFREGDSPRRSSPFFDEMEYMYGFGGGSRDRTKERSRLSRRRDLKFVPEPVTNTILVIGADPAQLADVERLIKIYDEGVRPDSNSVRITKQLTFQFTTAREVSEVIKDVFRDLLSPNDKALARNPQQQQQEQARSMYSTTYIFGESGDQDNARKFKGLLSMGVDDRSNTLTVSAPKDVMNIITEIAEELDRAAGKSRGVVKIMTLGSSLNSAQLQQWLSGVGKAPARPTESKPTQEPVERPPQPGQPQGLVNETIVVPQ